MGRDEPQKGSKIFYIFVADDFPGLSPACGRRPPGMQKGRPEAALRRQWSSRQRKMITLPWW
jgi:hypothetical protein